MGPGPHPREFPDQSGGKARRRRRRPEREIKVFNRVLRWTDAGLEYEADPRHAEILARDFGSPGPAVSTPGQRRPGRAAADRTKDEVPEEEEMEDEHEELLDEADARAFRSGAARANYLAMDRPDISFATKELCRRMSAPRRRDWPALTRVVRYLASEPRLAYVYAWQAEATLHVYVDTDFAGCTQTRRSTSGGCAMHGSHLVKHWSTTQKTVTLSSGEAELAGIVKGTAEGLGLRSLATDLGYTVGIRVYADSAAAIGICRRCGIGRVRHLATGQLWVQEKIRSGDVELCKVPGGVNIADLLTKYIARELADRHLAGACLLRGGSRAASAPHIVG